MKHLTNFKELSEPYIQTFDGPLYSSSALMLLKSYLKDEDYLKHHQKIREVMTTGNEILAQQEKEFNYLKYKISAQVDTFTKLQRIQESSNIREEQKARLEANYKLSKQGEEQSSPAQDDILGSAKTFIDYYVELLMKR